MKKVTIGVAACLAALLSGCGEDDAVIASRNLSKGADNFEILRRVVFLNGITDTYLMEILGYCSIRDQRTQLEVTCKVGDGVYKKHFLGLSDNVTYFVEHLYPTRASAYHYRVTFKPQSIFPDYDFRGSVTDHPLMPQDDVEVTEDIVTVTPKVKS